MPASFVLGLDTRAPELTWGAVAGTAAGELLRVAYTVDEPELVDATLRLPDGRQRVVTIAEDRLEVLLPPDTTTGSARLRATVRDDVGNEAVFELVVAVEGVAGGAIAGPRGAPSGSGAKRAPLRTPGEKLITTRSTASTRSSTAVQVERHEPRTSVTTSARDAVTSSVRARSRGSTSSRDRVMTFRAEDDVTAGAAMSSGDVVRRRDGPSIEEALLLDLL